MSEAGSDDGATDPVTAPTNAMRADEQWGLRDVAMPPWAHNRDNILEHLKGKTADSLERASLANFYCWAAPAHCVRWLTLCREGVGGQVGSHWPGAHPAGGALQDAV